MYIKLLLPDTSIYPSSSWGDQLRRKQGLKGCHSPFCIQSWKNAVV